MREATALLEACHISKQFSGVSVLKDIDFAIRHGCLMSS